MRGLRHDLRFIVLSYQHAFHAGNHADVLKHLCWIGVINNLKKKNKPFTLYDTHSGAGLYQLDDDLSAKNKEYLSGVDKVTSIKAETALANEYLTLCNHFLKAREYAGSPAISAFLKRETDILHLMELHPQEFSKLDNTMSTLGGFHTHVHHRNGFEGLVALTPAQNNRGAVLIDPPYEQLTEYSDVVSTVEKVLSRWQQAQIVVWYPLLSERAGEKSGASLSIRNALAELGRPCFDVRLTVMDNTPEAGMYGSGLCVINPSWQLDIQLADALGEITPSLNDSADCALRWLNADN